MNANMETRRSPADNDTRMGMSRIPAFLGNGLCMVKDNLQRVRGAMKTKAKHAAAVTDEYVKENPLKVMGFASAASIVISVLLIYAWAHTSGKTAGGAK